MESYKINLCQVCGDKARIFNYGALTCSPCRTFFRRHGFHPKNVRPCKNAGNCKINIQSRTVCIACRFGKCLAMGMCPDLIRKQDLSRQNRRQKQLFIAQSSFTPQPSTLCLLSNDRSSLTTSNWTLLSNVIHAFDCFTPVSKAQNIVKHINSQANIEQSFDLMFLIYSSVESFISSTADFRIMTTVEQCSLIQRNMRGLWAFHSIFTFRESGVFDNRSTEKAVFLPLYGASHVQRAKRITTQLDYDSTLIKLLLIILTFSSNCFAITEHENLHKDSLLYGTFRLLGSQNVYVELMWKYMIYRYGFTESIRRFAALIKITLDLLKLASDIHESDRMHQLLFDEITEQTKHSLTITDQDNVLLWGKSW